MRHSDLTSVKQGDNPQRFNTGRQFVLCELRSVPLQLFGQKMILKYVARLVDLPGDRLVKMHLLMCLHVRRFWWQKLVALLAQHHLEGLLAEGAFSVSNAVQTLRDDWFTSQCQSLATQTSICIDNMCFDSDRIAQST